MLKKRPNRRSIKEAADTLPAGICFFSSSGMIRLCNRQMLRLYRAMAHRDLQTLPELRQALAQCGEHTVPTRLPGRRQTYRFPDGRVWQYTECTVAAGDGERYTQALFSEVTELYEKQLALEAQIQKLRQMALRLRELSENAVEAAKEREILAAKTRLHAHLGENLTVMRQILSAPGSGRAQDAAVQAMRRTVAFLMADSEKAGEDSGFDEFLQAAAGSGVAVHITGALPEAQETRAVFIIAMRECLTNCVRHGEASALHIALSREGGSSICTLTNNGAAPEGEITPQGGLRNLQRHVANCGGEMVIRCRPAFSLTITIPEREEHAP